MKYLFIVVFAWAIIKLFVLKNIKNKPLYITFCLVVILAGILNLIFEPSMADLLKRWM